MSQIMLVTPFLYNNFRVSSVRDKYSHRSQDATSCQVSYTHTSQVSQLTVSVNKSERNFYLNENHPLAVCCVASLFACENYQLLHHKENMDHSNDPLTCATILLLPSSKELKLS